MIYPDPKPPRTEKKPRKPLPRSYVVTRRRKARKGRLRGDDLANLREQCFDRDRHRCVRCGAGRNLQMAHIKAKRIGLDSLSNVQTKCSTCHAKEHNWGKSMTKPVKKKERL